MTDLFIAMAGFFCLTVFMNEARPEPFLIVMSLFCMVVSIRGFITEN